MPGFNWMRKMIKQGMAWHYKKYTEPNNFNKIENSIIDILK